MSKQKRTFFSIVIPTYNMEKFIKKSVKSVLNQTYKNFEILVIDNHSKDKTRQIINNFKSNKIKYFKIKNYGVIGKSRNLGIKKSKGNWIAFLDADDQWFKHRLLIIKKEIEKKNFDYIASSEIIRILKKKKIWHYGFKKNNIYENFLRFGSVFSTSASVVKKNFLSKNKIIFSENIFFSSFEDFDFFLNMSRKNAKFHFIRDVLGEHLFHKDSTTLKKKDYDLSYKKVIKSHVLKQKFTKNKDKLFKEIMMYHNLKKDISGLLIKRDIFKNLSQIFLKFLFKPLYFLKLIKVLIMRQINFVERLN